MGRTPGPVVAAAVPPMPTIAPITTLPGGMSQAAVINLLGMTAQQVGWFGDTTALTKIDRYLRKQVMPVRPEDFTGSFRSGLKLAFGGVCADKIDGVTVNITDGRYDEFVEQSVAGLRDTLSCVIFGGTYWSWMPALARTAVKKAQVPIMGIMPVQGLYDLYRVRHLFEGDDPVPKMHYLALIGESYSNAQYTTFMASCADGLINIGGRDGARAEVDAFLNTRRPVFLAPVELPPDQDWLSGQVFDGLTYPRDTGTLVNMLSNDFHTSETPVGGSGLSFREHINTEEFTARHIRDVTVGIVSTSGSVTDTHRLGRVVDPLFQGVQRKTWYDRTGLHNTVVLGGMTAAGGIHRTYDAALKAQLATAGIMTWKGADYQLVRGVKEMIIVGEDWGQESDDFVDLVDVMVVLGPPKGKQGWDEAVRAMQKGKPVVIMHDPFLAPDTFLIEDGAEHVYTFRSDQIDMGIKALNYAIEEVLRRRRVI